MTTTASTIRDLGATLADAATLLDQASEAQWRRGYAPARREDTTERASGGHSDPTPATVADERRLEVRDAVDRLRGAVLVSTRAAESQIREASRGLEAALARWSGEPFPEMG